MMSHKRGPKRVAINFVFGGNTKYDWKNLELNPATGKGKGEARPRTGHEGPEGGVTV